MRLLALLFIALCGFCLRLDADVFNLLAGSPVSGGLDGKRALEESVVINGVSAVLKVEALEYDLIRAGEILRKLYPDGVLTRNADSILLEVKLDGSRRQRIYLVETGGEYPVVKFSVTLPGEIPAEFAVPAELKFLPGTVVLDSYVSLPERRAVYGAFTSPYGADETLGNITMSAAGWKPFPAESPDAPPVETSNGRALIRDDPMAIMLISAMPDDDGGVTGAIYQKPLKQK